MSEHSRRLLTQFHRETDPFFMGKTRHDKTRYEGSPETKPAERLYKYYTIARANR